MGPERRAPRYHFAATAEAVGTSDVRPAHVETLSFRGAYLAMPDPFEKAESIVVKIRSQTKFFQSQARVVYSNRGEGMGIEFVKLAPPFRIVLQEWLWDAVPQA